MPSRPLTREEAQMTRRLRDIWERKKHEKNLQQEDINRQLGWTRSVFSQYLNSRIPLNTDAVLKLSKALDVEPWHIDPALEPFLRHAGYATFAETIDTLTESELIALAVEVARRLPADDQLHLIQKLASSLHESRLPRD